MNRIKQLRKSLNIKQTELCQILGITQGALSGWENERYEPDIKSLKKMAEIFDVSIDYILGVIDTKQPTSPSNLVFLNEKNTYMLPVFESVSAGFGSSANDNITDYMPCYLNSEYEAQESIFIKVTGDSMYPKIEEGDLIQVHKQTSVDSGSIAVVLLDQTDGLVKRVKYGTDWIELHSINPMYPVQRFEGKDVLRIEILGLVKKIIKNV